jgi:hypothetical protein
LIEALRHRLGTVHHDSIEVKVAIIGELVFQCYLDLAKRRYM